MSSKDNESKENKSYENKSNVEFRVELSKDGKYFIFRHILTTVKPVNYVNKIQDNFVLGLPKDKGKKSSK